MARFNGENIEQYGSQGDGNGLSFFKLENDKDVARIRFLYNGAEDIEGYSVHRVKVGDKERDVNCLRDYNDPIDKCPFCAAHLPTTAKLYVPIFNEDKEEVQIWSRGKSFYSQISGWCARYPNTVGVLTDVERNGAKGDTKTRYNFYFVEDDKSTIEDILDDANLEQLPNPLGTIILDKTADEMETYLQTGDFGTAESVPSRRNRQSEPSRRGSQVEEDAPFEIEDNRSSRRGRRNRGGKDSF